MPEIVRYIVKWTTISIIVGIVAASSAYIFHLLVTFFQTLTSNILYYNMPKPIGEGGEPYCKVGLKNTYLIPLLIALGCLISGVISQTLAHGIEGHGVDIVIQAYHKRNGYISLREPIAKLFMASITIGLGGSAGRQGPIAHIAAGFASTLSRLLKLPPLDRKVVTIIGMGAGISALFKAPLGGAFFAAEVLYRRGIEFKILYPAILASIVSYLVFGSLMGFTPIFGVGHYDINIAYIPLFILVGLLSGFMAKIYIRTFYKVTELFHKLNVPKYIRTAVGGLLTGFIALFLPQVMGVGYGWIQRLMLMDLEEALTISGTPMNIPPIVMLLLLPFAKIVATALTIGSGSGGGVFAPGLFIGASMGALVGYTVSPLIFNPQETQALIKLLVIMGMLAHFSAASKTVLAVPLMVLEMTGSLKLLPLALLTMIMTHITSGGDTIYRYQKVNNSYLSLGTRLFNKLTSLLKNHDAYTLRLSYK